MDMVKRAFLFPLAMIFLFGCQKGMDKKLSAKDTTEFMAEARAAMQKMQPDQKDAMEWAFSNFSKEIDLAKIDTPTPRKIMQEVAERKMVEAIFLLTDLEKTNQDNAPVKNEILKISASDPTYEAGHDFFGDKTLVKFRVSNNGNLSYSSLQWKASLFINGDKKPVATTVLFDSYVYKDNWLNPGEKTDRTLAIDDHGFDSQPWHTLEVTRAKSKKIKIELIPEEAKDLGERYYFREVSAEKVAFFKEMLKNAKFAEQIAKAS